jgi:hypothetical protein
MNTKFALAIVAAAIIVGGFWIWMQNSASMNPTSAVSERNLATEKNGIYYIGSKPVSEGYALSNGKLIYVTRIQYDNGPANPPGVRYDTFTVPADPATFNALNDSFSNDETIGYRWGRDAQGIFYEGLVVEPAYVSTSRIDLASFSPIHNSYLAFGKDKNSVFEIYNHGDSVNYAPHSDLDAATFEFVGDICAKDKNGSYLIDDSSGTAVFTKVNVLTQAQCAHPGPGP